MSIKKQVIHALRALCAREGGPDAVADGAGISAEYIKQILAGVKLPSGETRGVGPKVASKLDARYPGWSNLGDNESEPQFDHKTNADETLDHFAQLLAMVPVERRVQLSESVAQWIKYGGQDLYRTTVRSLLLGPDATSRKRTGT